MARFLARISYYSNPNCPAGRVRGRPGERFQAHGSDKEIAIARRKPDRENLVSVLQPGDLADATGALSVVEILIEVLRNAARCDGAGSHGIHGGRSHKVRVEDLQAPAVVLRGCHPVIMIVYGMIEAFTLSLDAAVSGSPDQSSPLDS